MGLLGLLAGIAGIVLIIWGVSLAVHGTIIGGVIAGVAGLVLLAWATGNLRL